MGTRKEYAGGAVETTITGTINATDTTIVIDDASGWPDGDAGARPFVVVLDAGLPAEEKVLVTSRSGTTLTVALENRGFDGTTAQSHQAGAAIRHCIDADTFTDLSDHVYDTGRDDHSQYHTAARHAAVSHSAAMLADGAVTTAKINDSAVTEAKIANDAVTGAKIAGGAVDDDALHVDQKWSPGDIKWSAAAAVPSSKWGLLDGATYDSVADPTLAALFSVIGTTWGGTGASNFKVPDARGRFPMVVGPDNARGSSGGADEVTITANHLPTHTHAIGGDSGGESAHTHGAGSFAAAHSHTPQNSDVAVKVAVSTLYLVSEDAADKGSAPQPVSFILDAQQLTDAAAGTVAGTSAAGSAHVHAMPAATGDNTTDADPLAILPPYLALNAFIKLRA